MPFGDSLGSHGLAGSASRQFYVPVGGTTPVALPLAGMICFGLVVLPVGGIVGALPHGGEQFLEELVCTILETIGASGWVLGVLGVIPLGRGPPAHLPPYSPSHWDPP